MTDLALSPTPFIDSEHPEVIDFTREYEGTGSDLERAVHLYYAVRDGFRYDPYGAGIDVEGMRASATLASGRGWCVAKAILLAACCRASNIPARLGFADVRNHLSTANLRDMMKTDVFYWHGYTSIGLEGRWVKATPAFNVELCEKFGLLPLEFDGRSDSIYHPFDRDGETPHGVPEGARRVRRRAPRGDAGDLARVLSGHDRGRRRATRRLRRGGRGRDRRPRRSLLADVRPRRAARRLLGDLLRLARAQHRSRPLTPPPRRRAARAEAQDLPREPPDQPLQALVGVFRGRRVQAMGKYESVSGPAMICSPKTFAAAHPYTPAPENVFVATQMKCGTTWI